MSWLITLFLSMTALGSSSPDSPYIDDSRWVPKPGTYVGYSTFKSSNFKIPTTLEIVRVSNGGEPVARFLAFLKFSMGGFISHEYFGFYYEIKDFDWTVPYIALDPNRRDSDSRNSNELALVGGRYDTVQKMITGMLQSSRAGRSEGTLKVFWTNLASRNEVNKRLKETFSEKMILPALTGSYVTHHADCTRSKYLQIEAIRKYRNDRFSLKAYNGYYLRGRLGSERPPIRVPHTSLYEDQYYILSRLEDGDLEYDFYQDRLQILGSVRNNCQVTPTGIQCGSCLYKRQPRDHEFLREFVKDDFDSPPANIPFDEDFRQSVTADTPGNEVEGAYLGFLHFEKRNKTVPLSIDVNFAGAARTRLNEPIGKQQISLRANILFLRADPSGDLRTRTDSTLPLFLASHPFQEGQSLVLWGERDDILHVLHQTKDLIYGILYHREFGRVGRFYVTRKNARNPDVLCNLLSGTSLDGRYEYILREPEHLRMVWNWLDIRLIQRNTIEAGRAYFPYAVEAKYYGEIFAHGLSRREPFDSGSADGVYDLYTGVMSVTFNDGFSLLMKYDGGSWKGTLDQTGFVATRKYLKLVEFNRRRNY